EEAFDELDKLGWIKQQSEDDRNQLLAAGYLSAVKEKKKPGENKNALGDSATHAEGEQITTAIREGLKARGSLETERLVDAWVPAHLTDAQKTDATEYEPGDLVQFQQNSKGFKKGSRLIVSEGETPPIDQANRF